VIDLLGGCAVHARAGTRNRYAPVQRVAGWPIDPGDARALAGVYIDLLGIPEIYAADLDAILEKPPQDALARDLSSLGVPLSLDAGIRSVDDALRAMELGAAHLVIGLETLPSFSVLADICTAVGGDRVTFSLDLRDGQPVVMKKGGIETGQPVESLVMSAADAGVGSLIVIDLARVGTNTGIDCAQLDRARAAAPGLRLVAGGGVRGWQDLVTLAGAGCDGVLLATTLHSGRISAEEILAARAL
jgi:phosphoribosylformimino-5-aminoimidazole carboxamide ribotide isomerase